MLIILATFEELFLSNMKRYYIILGFMMFMIPEARAQYEYMDGFSIDYKNRHDKIIEIQGTFGIGHYGACFRRLNMFKIDLEKKWYWGIGLRLGAAYAVSGNFLTANPALTRKSKLILAVLSEPDPFSTDTIVPFRAIVLEAGFQWMIQHQLRENLEVAFLMDLFGANLGLTSQARVIAKGSPQPETVNVNASLLSLNLFSDHTRGNIRYELLCRYWLNHKWGISGGPAFLFRELRTGQAVNDANRFRRKQWAFNLTLVWAPYHKKFKD